MKIKVQTKSGEFEYDCEQDEILLYAGLRHGLTLPYECATGTCGTCRARVVEGEARLEWADAPGMSYVKQEKNEILMCRATALGDCSLRVPAKVSEGIDHDVLPGYRNGEIGNVRLLTHDVMCFDLSLDRPVTFDAGQFVVLEAAEVMGGRAFSMVNYRRDAETLKFVIKRKPDGKFSNWLFDRDVKGENVDVYGPLGKRRSIRMTEKTCYALLAAPASRGSCQSSPGAARKHTSATTKDTSFSASVRCGISFSWMNSRPLWMRFPIILK